MDTALPQNGDTGHQYVTKLSNCHVNNAASPLHLSLEPAADMGPNYYYVVWAPSKFFYIFFAFDLIQLTYIFFISDRFWFITMKWPLDNDNGTHKTTEASPKTAMGW
jgi:hypothetical protein